MGGVHRPTRIEVGVVRCQHADVVGYRLQLAGAALLAGRADVVTFDEQHLQDAAPDFAQLLDLALHDLARGRRRGAGSLHAAVDFDQTHPTTAV